MAEVSVDYELFRRYRTLLGTNVVAFWPFFEQNPGAGELYSDDGPLGHHITNIVAFDDAPMLRGFMMAPRFNGVDEYLQHADHDDFSFGADGTAPNEICITVNLWVNIETDRTDIGLVGKDDSNTPDREWTLFLDNNGYFNMEIWDDSVPASVGCEYQTALPMDEWLMLTGRYEGGGVDAGVNLFVNGAQVVDVDTGAGAYIACENTIEEVLVGARQAAAIGNFYQGDMALVSTCDHPVLTDATIAELYRTGRRLLEV